MSEAVSNLSRFSINEASNSARRGRPTIPDNLLLGARNEWTQLFEECWPSIGWSLVCLSRRRKAGIQDVQAAFESVKGHLHNAGLARPLYEGGTEKATPSDVRNTRTKLSETQAQSINSRAEFERAQYASREAEQALALAKPHELSTIQLEAARREEFYSHVEKAMKRSEAEYKSLSSRSRWQEAYVYRSELLDFVRSGRYAVQPRNLAKALAGLPHMRWRQSFDRCTKLAQPFNPERLEYSLFRIIEGVCDRCFDPAREAPVELFREELEKLPKKFGTSRVFLWDNWFDLKQAIQEVWKSSDTWGPVPFFLTSRFLDRTRRQKDPVERIFAQRERIS